MKSLVLSVLFFLVTSAVSPLAAQSLATWAEAASPTTKTFNKVHFANGAFIAAGNGDVNAGGGAVVVRSTDGITWQKVFENTASPFFAGCGVAYATDGWVVGGNWGKALTSPDGVNWTVRSSPLADPMNGVVANGASLVAACNVGNILFSSDSGATWSTRSSGTSNGLGGVAYGNGLYVVSGASGTILTSPDGSSWTARSSGTAQGIWSIAYANSMFVAVGQGGTILTSPDGTTWTARSSGVTGDLNSVTRGAGLWMVVGSGGRVLLSADGVTWTTQASGLSHNLVSVSFGAGRFVVVGESGRIHSLVPGEPRQLWASLNKGFGGPAGALGFNNGLFVAGWGDSVEGGTIATSTDGVSWTVRQTVSGAGMYSTAYGNGRHVVGSNWGKVYSSADGVTWTLGSYGDPSPLYVGFFNGKFIGTAGDGTTRYTSTDGITWTRVATGSQFGGSFANNGTTLVSAGAGTLQWSSDGLVWNNPTTALPQVWYIVVYGAGLFVAIDQSGHIYTSPDGKVWTSRVSPINSGLSLAYGGGRFVVFGSGGVTAESRDGVSWFAGNSNVSLDLTRAAYGNSRFVGVASGGRLLVSNLETQTDLNFGLVARYAFDGDARDSGPDGLHLNAGAAVSEFVADRAGNPRGAVRFISRNTNDFFFTGTGPALANQSSSVAFWVRKEFTGEGTWVFGLGSGGSSGKTMVVALDYSGSPIRYSFYYDDFNTPNSVASNAWAHVACTFDAATRERRIYLNGVLQGTNTAAYGFSGDTALTFGLAGIALDDLRFYNRVLSGNEVTTLAAPAGSPPVISTQPQSQTVAPGSAVTLSVTASGSPNPTYQWRKNGVAIAGATSSTLSLPAYSGAAGFDVIISNSFGSITSRKSWVTAMTWSSVTVSGTLNDAAFNDSVGIAVGDSGRILRSTDGGFTWTAVSSGVTDNFQAVKHAGAGVFYACGWLWGAHGIVLKSADNGLTWTQVLGLSGTGQELFGLHAPTPKIVYVAGTNQIRKSTDGGSTWATTTFPNGYEYNVERLGSRLVAIANAGTNSFRYSTDDGATWNLATTQVPTVLDAAKLGDSLFVAGDAGAIYRTEDGITYTNVGASSGLALRSLACLADQLYAVDTGKLYTVDPTGATRLVKDSGSTVNAVAASGSRLFVLGNNVILVGTPAVADPAVPVEGLLAHFAFDGSAADSSPYARSASPVSVTYGPDRAGRVGSAAVFNGSSSLVTVPSAAELSFTGDFTLSLWANLGTPVTQMLLAKHKAYGADPGFIFVRRDYGYDFEPPYSTASPELTTAAGSGKWSHLVFTFSPASQEYAFYVDGVLQKGGWNGGTVLSADSTPLYLGAEPHANGSIQNYVQGSLDELRIYGRALSHSEIRGLYAAEAAAPAPVVPVVTLGPPSQTFVAGGSLTLSASVTGTPAPTYQWRRNGFAIVGATSSTYTAATASPALHRGWYQLVATNSVGTTVSSPVFVNVSVTPAQVLQWGGSATEGSPPAGLTRVSAIASKLHTSLALREDGTVAAWGGSNFGQASPPAGLSGVVAIAGAWDHALALRGDGTVVAWGGTNYGQTSVPAGLSGVVAIAVGASHSAVVKSDGRVVCWGWNAFGQCNVPAGLVDVVGVAAGYGHTLALKRDGTVVGWGMNQGELNIPAGLTGVVKIDAGDHLSVALKSDGTVVAWGDNYLGKNTVPTGLAGVIDIAAGRNHVLALKSDGTVVSWGDNTYGQTTAPASSKGAVALAGGSIHSLALIERSPLLDDAFAGSSLDTSLWSTQLPYGDAAVTVANGVLRSSNRGLLVSKDSIGGSLVLRTRIKLHGDRTSADLFWRSDAAFPALHGIVLGLYHESQRIKVGIVGVTPLTDQNWKPYSLPLETWIEVVIVDSGSAVEVYLNGEANPAIRFTYTAAEAANLPSDGRIVFMSRESAYTGGSAASLDYITLTRNAPGAPVISGATTVTASVGIPFTYQITATNSPTSYAATGLPAGLSLNSTTGLISGTPTTAGTSNVSLTATSAAGVSAVVTLVLSTTPGTGFAQVPSYVPTGGLVHYYSFDNNLTDSVSSVNGTAVNGATFGRDRFGVDNATLSLDGVNDHVALSNTFYNGASVNALTYSIWFKTPQLPTGSYHLSAKESYWKLIALHIEPGGVVAFDGSSSGMYFGVRSASGAVNANQWNHVVVTLEGGILKMYVNGVLASTSQFSGSNLEYAYQAAGNSSATNYIGAWYPISPGLTGFFMGQLDDFGLWNRALSPQEVSSLYGGGQGVYAVTSPVVNEASPYAVFTVTGSAGQAVSLALGNGTATGGGTDYGSATATTNLQYSVDNGANWLNYSTTGAFALPVGGAVLVRTPIVNDTISDNGETFTLTATNTGGTGATGTCTIKDDGTGDIYNGDGTKAPAAPKDDDRGLTVAGTTVNEASPYTVFTVTGIAGQTVSLALANGTATGGGADYGSATATTNLQYSIDNGANWLSYSTTGAFSLPAGGSVLVRTPIVNDTTPDNGETFTLTATNTGGTGATGTCTIKDDGTGDIYKGDGTKDTTAPKDDDRPSATPVAPAFTTQPQSQTASASGGTVSFSVAVSGTPAPALQWYFNGAPIPGATGTTLTLTNVQASAAGNYWVVATNGAGSAKSSLAAFSLTQPGNSGTQALVGPGYTAGQTLTVTNTLSYTGTASALSWAVLLPQGWSYVSSGGSAGEQGPAEGTTDVLEWAWTSVPPSPVTFTYTVNIPAGTSGPQEIVALGGVRNGASLQFLAQPDPLPAPQVTTHSADTDRNFRFSLLELTRVIELYNTRNGTTRTGCYAVATIATEDGFAPDSARASSAVVTLARYHSADSNRDGKISLLELTRVIELYNYRSGTTRTGQYKVQPGTEDGFAPGPGTTVVNIQMVIDHDSALVIAPTGLYWRHYGYAKPGFYGDSYEIPGPFLIGTQTWTPTWDTPGSRDPGVSSVFAMNTSGFSGWSLSQSYGGAFNSYPQDSGATVLAQSLSLNRGTVTSTTVDGFPAIRFQDFFSGQNVYSVDLKFER